MILAMLAEVEAGLITFDAAVDAFRGCPTMDTCRTTCTNRSPCLEDHCRLLDNNYAKIWKKPVHQLDW